MKFNNIKENKAITVIALIITIIILLILAGITISTLGGENGLIARAKLAKTEQEKAQAKEELQMKIYQLQIKIMDEESREATLEDFNNMIKEDVDLTFISASYKNSETTEENFKTIKVLYNKYIFTVDEYLQITDVELNTEAAHVDLTYEVKEKKEEDGKIFYETLIILQSPEKITKVVYGEQELYADSGNEKIAFDYKIEKGVEYKFKVTVEDGREVEKTFVINQVPITSLKITEKLSLGEGLNKKVSVEEIKPDFADVGKITFTSSDESVAKVDEEGNVTGVALGTAVITAKEEYSSLEAKCDVSVIDIMAGIEVNCAYRQFIRGTKSILF